jgi:hypothetical protein
LRKVARAGGIDHASTMLDLETLDTVGLPLQPSATARRRAAR